MWRSQLLNLVIIGASYKIHTTTEIMTVVVNWGYIENIKHFFNLLVI